MVWNKRGLQHIDWAFSASIFFIGVIIFFLIISSRQEQPDTSGQSLAEQLLADITPEFSEYLTISPILTANYISNYEPFIIPVAELTGVTTGYWWQDGTLLLFSANVTNATRIDLITGNYSSGTAPVSITATSTAATAESMTANFANSLLTSTHYLGTQQIKDVEILVDGSPFAGTGSFLHKDFVARYRSLGSLNHSTYVFADQPYLFMYLNSNDLLSHDVEVVLDLNNYTAYYVSQLESGNIVYDGSCIPLTNVSFLDIYKTTGVAFSFTQPISLDICNDNENLSITLQFDDLKKREGYTLRFHTGDYTTVSPYSEYYRLGFTEPYTTTTLQRIQEIMLREYDAVKANYSLPQRGDFRIMVSSDTYNASLGPDNPNNKNVFIATQTIPIIDSYLNSKPLSIKVAAWS